MSSSSDSDDLVTKKTDPSKESNQKEISPSEVVIVLLLFLSFRTGDLIIAGVLATTII